MNFKPIHAKLKFLLVEIVCTATILITTFNNVIKATCSYIYFGISEIMTELHYLVS